MTIHFDWFETPKPNAEGKTTLHARPSFNGTTDTKTIAKHIQQRCSLTVGDIVGVLSELSDVIGYEMQNGRQVHLKGLGYFAPTLGVDGEVTADIKLQVRNRKVHFKSVSFRPDKEFRASIGSPKLQRTRLVTHSLTHTKEEIQQRALEDLLGLKKSAACSLLLTLKQEGALLNEGTPRQPIYVPAPGYFGTNSIGG